MRRTVHGIHSSTIVEEINPAGSQGNPCRVGSGRQRKLECGLLFACHHSPRGLGSYACMTIHACMGSTTISLERSAYERLKECKQSGESFSDVVRRLTEPSRPSLRDLVGWVDKRTGDAIARTIDDLRERDVEPLRAGPRGRSHGRRARQ